MLVVLRVMGKASDLPLVKRKPAVHSVEKEVIVYNSQHIATVSPGRIFGLDSVLPQSFSVLNLVIMPKIV